VATLVVAALAAPFPALGAVVCSASYGFGRPVVVNNSSGGALTDYQVLVTLNTQTLITNGKMQSDCDDVRFLTSSGAVLSHWLESGCNTTSTRFWFKAPSLAVGANTFYMTYDSAAGSASDGDAVFIKYDDFSSNPNSNGKWSDIYRYGGDTTREFNWSSGSQSLFLTRSTAVNLGGGATFATIDPAWENGWAMSFRYRIGGGTGADGMALGLFHEGNLRNSSGGGSSLSVAKAGYAVELDGDGSTNDPSNNHIAVVQTSTADGPNGYDHLAHFNTGATEDNAWHTLAVRFLGTSVRVDLDGTQVTTHSDSFDKTFRRILFGASTGGSTNNHEIDDVFLRKLANPEPAGAPGTEEACDASAPVAGTVRDGTGSDIDWQTSTTTVEANWSGFTDAQSTIVGYEWAIGTSSGGTEIMGWTSVGTATSATQAGLPLPMGNTLYVSVRATNGGGLTAVATSDGVETSDARTTFADTYESGTLLTTDAPPGQWNEFYANAGLTITNSTLAARRGARGLRAVDATNTAGNDAAVQFYPTGQTDFYARTWVRATGISGSSETRLLQLLDRSDGGKGRIGVDLTGSGDLEAVDHYGALVRTPIGSLTPGTWYLLELGFTGGNTASGTVRVWLNGSQVHSASHDFTGRYVDYLKAGATNDTGGQFQGTCDFDDTRAGTTPNASKIFLVAPAGPTFVGVCNQLTAELRDSIGTGTVRNAPYAVTANTLVSGVTGTFYSDAGCSTSTTTVTIGSGQPSAAVWFKASGSGTASFTASHTDFFTGAATSFAVNVDGTPPTAGTVSDGSGSDIDFQVSTTTINANWTAFTDPQSGISTLEWAIGTTSGGQQVQAFTTTGISGDTATRAGLGLSNGTQYFVTVRATNGAGTPVTASSDGVTVDTSGPVAGAVSDGTGTDVDWQSSTTTINANWTAFTDPQSGVAQLEWAIGTSSGGQQIQAFTTTGISGNTAARGALSLANGTQYFVTVRATSGTGAQVTASSDGITVDTSGPIAGAVSDGTGTDVDWQSSTTTINANWTAFTDPQSGIATLEWAIGTTSGGSQIQVFTTTGVSGNTASNSSLTLSNAITYYVTVRATSGTGAQITATSDGVTVDNTGPAPGTVSDGVGADIDWQASTTTINASWTAFTDAQSGIGQLEWAIGTTSGGQQIQAFTTTGVSGNAGTRAGLSLSNGQIYFVTVRATSGTGAQVTATSDGVTVDTSGPVAGVVSDGVAADIDWQSSTTTIDANWTAFIDGQSGITGYEWAIGTTSGGTQIQGFTSVGLGTSATNSSLALSNASTYFVTIRATSGTGVQVTASSDGVTVDTTGPVAGTVSDGTGADVDWQASTTTIQANWTAFTDPQSGIATLEWAIGTSSGGQEIQPFTTAGISGSTASNNALALSHLGTYYVTVRATSGTGAQITATSDGVTVDTSAPVAGTVADGSGADIDFQTSTATIQANWSGFADAQSGIIGYEWAIGTSSGGQQVQAFTSVGLTTGASNSSLSLSAGSTYFVTVRATNGTGAQVTATSDGVAVTLAPDHVVLSAVPSAAAGTVVVVTAQVVDSAGNPVGFDTPVQIAVTGSASIQATTLTVPSALPAQSVSGGAGADGAATVDVTNTVSQSVTVSVVSSGLPGANTPIGITFVPGPAHHARAVALGATTLNACGSTTLELAVVDAFDNVRQTASTVTLCPEALKSAVIGTTTLTSESRDGAGCVTGGLDAVTGKATAEVSDDQAETALFTPSQVGLPATAVSAAITWVVGPPDAAASLFDLDEGDGAVLTTYSGTVTARVKVRDACNLPVTEPVAVAFDAGAPLQVGSVGPDAGNPGEWIASVQLPSCPANLSPIPITATLDGNAVGGGTPIQRHINPSCTAPSAALTTVVANGPTLVDACWSLSQSGTPLPAGVGIAEVNLTVSPMDVNGQPMGAGHAVVAVEDPPRLRADAAVDHGNGSYTVRLGSDACGGVVPVIKVNGVTVLTVPNLDFTCPAVATGQTLAVTPPDADVGGSVTVSGEVKDVCGNIAFDRPLAVTVSLGALGTVPALTGADGRFSTTLTSAIAGRSRIDVLADGVSLLTAEAAFHLPDASMALALGAMSGSRSPGAAVTFPIQVGNTWVQPIIGSWLELGNEGLALIGVSLGGQNLVLDQGRVLLPDMAPGETLELVLRGNVSAAPGGSAFLVARAVEPGGRPLVEARSDMRADRLRMGVGCSCGAGGTAAGWMLGGLLAFLRAARRVRR
jgi:hypothetical protein